MCGRYYIEIEEDEMMSIIRKSSKGLTGLNSLLEQVKSIRQTLLRSWFQNMIFSL